MSIAGLIEKYDPYTLEGVKSALNSNSVYTTASNLITSEAHYNWNTEDLRAVIEYDGGQICKGKIDNVDSELGEINNNYQYDYKTSISATFPCYSDVKGKNVAFVYVVGSDKFRFTDIDLNKLK